jgi:putative OPT family oligopeptide transporter
VCCAAAVAGDNLQDLKAGQIVGATPWRQQAMLAVGAVSCAFVMAPVLNLLEKAYGIGVPTADHSNPLLAPQATLMASVAKGMFGGALPWGMVWTGAAIGAAIIALDELRKARGWRFRIPVLAVAVGIYLPLELSVPIFLGGVITYLVERRAGVGDDADALERLHRPGTLFSAGLITGEALMGIVIAIPIVMSGKADVLALPEALQPGAWGEWLGLALLAAIAVLLYRVAATTARAEPR